MGSRTDYTGRRGLTELTLLGLGGLGLGGGGGD